MKIIFLFIAIFIVSAKSFSQQSSTEIHYQYIDSLTQHAEANNNFSLIKSCINNDRDTINYYKNTFNVSLLKVSHILYNPSYNKSLENHGWDYYFLSNQLILVSKWNVVDWERVLVFTDYYFKDRKCFYISGNKHNLKSPKVMLENGDVYLSKFNLNKGHSTPFRRQPGYRSEVSDQGIL